MNPPIPEIWSIAWWDRIAPLVQATMVLVTGVVAVRSLNAWHRQLIGKLKTELAQQVLTDFYNVRDAFKRVRNIPIGVSEDENTRTGGGEEEKIKKFRQLYRLPIERLDNEKEIFSRLYASRYSFKGLFGDNAIEPFEKIREIHNNIFISAGLLAKLVVYEIEGERASNKDDLLDVLGWGRGGPPDEIDQAIDRAVAAVEALCKPVLEVQTFRSRFMQQARTVAKHIGL